MKHEMKITSGHTAMAATKQLLKESGALALLTDGVKAGDTKVVFDPENEDEVSAAKATFDKLVAKGYTAFHVKDKGEAGSKMKAFDPEAGKIILVPKMQGGANG